MRKSEDELRAHKIRINFNLSKPLQKIGAYQTFIKGSEFSYTIPSNRINRKTKRSKEFKDKNN